MGWLRPLALRGSLRHPLWAVCLAAAVLLGSVDLHPAGERHLLGEAGSGERFLPEAVHPDQPVHLEAATVEQEPGCPVCVLRLQSRGAELGSQAGPVLPALRQALPGAADPAIVRRSRHPDAARAPPLS